MLAAVIDDDLSPFAWLRGDPAGGEVAEWLAAREDELEGFRADRLVARERARAEAALREAISVPSTGAPALASGAVFTLDRLAGDAGRSVVRRRAGKRETVFRVEGQTIDWHAPSPSGRLLAVGLSTGGSERSAGHIVDLATGRMSPERLEGTRHASVAWLPDESAFAYSRYPGDRDYGRQLWLHRLGTPQSDDRLLWAGPDDTVDWPDIELAPDGATALIHVSRGWAATDVHLVELRSGVTTTIVSGRDRMTRLHFAPGGAIAGVTAVDAPRGRLVRVNPGRPGPEGWIELLPEGDMILDDSSVGDHGVFVVGEQDLSAVVGHVGVDPGGARGPVVWAELAIGDIAIGAPTPGQSTMRNRVVRHLDERTAVFSWSSPTSPAALWRWAPGGRPRPFDDAGASATGAAVRTHEIVVDDGAGIPVLIVEPAGCEGVSLPTLLHGYGGFGLSASAGYSELAVAWAALGGRYVEAGLRGGRERGDDWHRAGSREHRQRVFDDFAAVADALVAEGACERERLAVWGSSNGGLLMAATVVQRPDLCAAVHAAVPMTDMLGYHRLSIARLWMSDFGDPDDPADRPWIRAYSPMHNLPRAGTPLPDILVTTGLNDTRVAPFHAFAFVEALRALRDPDSRSRLLLEADPQAGHGIGKPADAFVRERADAFALFLSAFAARAADSESL